MKATNFAIAALLTCSAVDAATSSTSTTSGFWKGLTNLKQKTTDATTKAVTDLGWNRVDVGPSLLCPKPIGSILVPKDCPSSLDRKAILDLLFTESDPKEGKLYCEKALPALASLESIDVLRKAANLKSDKKNDKKIENALLGLMYKFVRLEDMYKPRMIQVKFNECLAALKNVDIECKSETCIEADFDRLIKKIMNPDLNSPKYKAIADTCYKIPTIKSQLNTFLNALKEKFQAGSPETKPKVNQNAHSLTNVQGIKSAFSKLESKSAFKLIQILSDGNYDKARARIAEIIKDFKHIRSDWFANAENEFRKIGGEIVDDKKSMTITNSSVQTMDFNTADQTKV